ncbi:hypothetical protein D3C75_910340 [compost metagenome]
MTGRVAAERADTGTYRRIENEFAFIQVFIDLPHHHIRRLNPYAYIDLIIVHFKPALLQHLGQPGRAVTAGGNHHVIRLVALTVFEYNSRNPVGAVLLNGNNILNLRLE